MLVLLIQACTTEPKLQFQASKIELNSPLFTKQWKGGITEIKDGHTIKRSENEYTYRIVSEKMVRKTDLNEAMTKRQKKFVMKHFIKWHPRRLIQRYNKEGQLYKAVLYENGEKKEVREYNDKKMMIHSTPYENGEKHGVEQVFFYTTGGLENESLMTGNKKEDEEYSKNKISLRTKMDGCRHGMEKAWHCGTGILERETPIIPVSVMV